MVKKYELNTIVSVINYMEFDISLYVKNLTLVKDINQDSLVIAIGDESNLNDLKKNYKNIVLISNDHVPSIPHIRNYNQKISLTASNFINELTMLLNCKNLICFDTSDFIKSLRNKEMFFLKEKKDLLDEKLKQYDKVNIKTIFLNIYITYETKCKEVENIIDILKCEFGNDVNIIFSTIISKKDEISLILI